MTNKPPVNPAPSKGEELSEISDHSGRGTVPCKRCGAANSPDQMVRHSADDALQVSECRHCGSILEIAGHRW